VSFIFGFIGAPAMVGFIVILVLRRRLLTVQVESNGISYARGRGDLQWTRATWGDVRHITERSRTYRGSTTHWIEVEFNGQRKKLKIPQSIDEYRALRDLLLRTHR
jgi:hypothetical protein